jgi:thiol:disulfide interchange protein
MMTSSSSELTTTERRAQVMRWFSLARTVFWLLLVLPAVWLGWLQSVVFVSLLSLWALVETAFAAWRSDENPDSKRLESIEKKLDQVLAQAGAEGPSDQRVGAGEADAAPAVAENVETTRSPTAPTRAISTVEAEA